MVRYRNYSVLMSVYYKEAPQNLMQAIESMQKQSIKTDDFVLVCDGPLPKSLDDVIDKVKAEMGETLHIVRLPQNRGLGIALNEGLGQCKNELVARMDSDDISYSDRCQRQIEIFNTKPEVSICSGTIEEFDESPCLVKARRKLPQTNGEILEFAKKRNPFNHPCVMYKKTDVMAVGSYKDFYLLEDYYLWIRMLLKGYQGYNIQDSLLYMRAGADMYKRRAGIRYLCSQMNLFDFMLKQHFITRKQYVLSCLIRGGSALAPNWFRRFLFKKKLRS